jgi:phosphatidylinositol alpha-1,6-mannosyltransferase
MPLHILTHEFFPKIGGAGIFVEETAQAAVQLGYKTTVWAPDPGPRAPHWSFQVKALPHEGNQGWYSRLSLAGQLNKVRAEIAEATVHLAEPGPMRAWMYLSGINGWRPGRLILTFHGSEILNLTRFPHRRALLRGLVERADRIHVLSEYNRNLLQRDFPEIPINKWCVTGAAPRNLGEPPEEDFKRLPAREGRTVLLTVGRIHPRKGHHRVLEALGSLPESLRRDVVYWIAGPIVRGNYARQLEGLARRHRIETIFLGSLSTSGLQAAYRQSDIFTMTSGTHYRSIEGLGLVYLEAGQAGLPVIATHTGGVSEVVHHQRNGLLVPVDDLSALAGALSRLINDQGLRALLGSHGRELAQTYSWAHVAAQIYA